jgi:YbbR domain-containing protein
MKPARRFSLINRKLLEKITEKWPVKVLSVAAALIISVFYRMHTLETRSFSVPLNIEPNTAFVPASSFAQVVRVSLRGESNTVFSIAEEDIEAYIDLSRFSSEGSHRMPVKIRKRGGALGVEPLEVTVEPAEIHIRLENKTGRAVNVYPVFQGRLAEGFELIDEFIIPETIYAQGPRGRMENLVEFNTAAVDLDGRSESFTVRVNVINNDPFIEMHGSRTIEYQAVIQRITRSASYQPLQAAPLEEETNAQAGDEDI